MYKWYSPLLEEEKNNNKAWIIGIANINCALNAFDSRKLVLWCAKRFDTTYMII